MTIGPETPSAEGPLTTTEAQSFGFSTYAPLRIEEHRCSWYDNQCPPLTPFSIRFNNPLDMDVFSEDMLKVEPEIPGMICNVYGNSIEISGETKGQTTYTVTVSGKIQDIFGQQLGKDASLKFKVDKAEPVLVNTGQNFLTLDPSASKAVFSVYAINYKKAQLESLCRSTHRLDCSTNNICATGSRQMSRPKCRADLLKINRLLLIFPDDTLTQVDIDLSKYMDGNFGHFVVIVEPPAGIFESDNDKWQRFSQTIITWVQVTQIGLDAYTDHSEMVAWATDLKEWRAAGWCAEFKRIMAARQSQAGKMALRVLIFPPAQHI